MYCFLRIEKYLIKYTTILNAQFLEKERIGELTEAQTENQGIENAVNLRLRRDDLEESGKLTRLVSHNYENITHDELADIPRIQILRDHKGNIESCVELLIFRYYNFQKNLSGIFLSVLFTFY